MKEHFVVARGGNQLVQFHIQIDVGLRVLQMRTHLRQLRCHLLQIFGRASLSCQCRRFDL